MPRVHVLTHREQAEPERLAATVVLVVDIVFATSGIAIALERGAAEVIPTVDVETARRHAAALPSGETLLLGERDGAPIEGFLPPWPLALMSADLSGKHLVYSTTNGTVALRGAAAAGLTLAASLLNAQAVVQYARAHAAGRDIVVLCAGSGPSFSLEDFYGAGCLVAHLTRGGAAYAPSDAARASRLLYQGASARACLEDGYAGRVMRAQGLQADLEFCMRENALGTVPVFAGGCLVRG